MGTLLQNLLDAARQEPGADVEPFKPVARYYPSMDFLLYLTEDCSYRGDRVDRFLTVLWHPHEKRLVGIKLKGFRYIFGVLKSLLDLDDEKFLPLSKALEYVMSVGGLAINIMEEQTPTGVERMKLYDEVRKFIEDAKLDPREMRQAA